MLKQNEEGVRNSRARRWLGQFEWKASPYLYIAPFFVLFAIVGVFPLIYTVWVALRQYNTLTGDSGWAVCGATCGGGTQGSMWGNFSWVLHQQVFYVALRNSISIFLLTMIPQLIIALFLAWVLDSNLRAKTFWRIGVLLPFVIAPSAAGIIFSQIFSDKMGAVNVFLQLIGLDPIMWHGSAFWSHVAISVIVNFRSVGYNTLIFLAGMQAISHDVLEAAVIDGAGKWRTFRSVTLPLLRPTMIFVMIQAGIAGLQIFDEPQMFNNGASAGGGANNQFLTVSMYLYKLGFTDVAVGQPNLGRAAAVAWCLFVIIVAIALINFSVTKRIASAESVKGRPVKRKRIVSTKSRKTVFQKKSPRP